MNLSIRKAVENMSYAVMGQIVAMILSFVLSLIVPRFLETAEFAYWQLFMLYVGYVGIAHLGLNDGIYLRLGGKKYEELDLSVISSQFWILVVEQVLLAILFFTVALRVAGAGSERFFVLAGTIFFMILDNITQFVCYIFQAVNQIKRSAITTMVFNSVALLLVIVMLVMKVDNFRGIVLCYVGGRLCSFLYILFWGRGFVFRRPNHIKYAIKESIKNINVGIKLLLANLLSTFLWGVGRYITDAKWGIEEFGKFAYAISLMNFYNALIYQIGMAFFPVLRQCDRKQQKDFFCLISDFLCIVIPVGYLLYYPAKCLLHIWLPQYDISVKYLSMLLPLCLLEGIVQVLTNTYLKVLRKEKDLLWLNAMATFLCAVLSIIGAFLFDSIISIVLSIVVAITLRSVLAQFRISRLLGIGCTKRIIGELVIAGIFGVSAWTVEGIGSWVIIILSYIVYLVCYKKQLIVVQKWLKSAISSMINGKVY